MLALQGYGSSDDDNSENEREPQLEEITSHLKPLGPGITITSLQNKMQVCSAPNVVPTGAIDSLRHIDSTTQEVMHNPKFEELFAPELGPENPFQTRQQRAHKNMLSGYVEQAHISDFQFENQRRTFNSYAMEAAKEADGRTVFESTKERPSDKRKRSKNDNPSDVEGFLGPWGGFIDEKRVMKPNEEEAAELEEILAKRQKRGKQVDDKPLEEKTVLHIKDTVDYQGRSFLHAPQDVGVNLRSDSPPERCFLPKAHIHTWQGHTKGITAIRWFPKTAHLLLSCSMDCRVKWDVRSGEIVQEYDRHLGAVNTITFVDENRRFVTTSDDKSLRVWEWDIPVDMKYIADPTMHSMPAVTPSPNQKWLACQSMDNKIVIFSALNRFKMNRKKTFSGHMVAGYACTLDFSPDMSYLVSGDADGKTYIWDWKTTKLYKKWKAHDSVCIGVLWHPHEPSKLVTAGWDGLIKYWD
ncbi:hypothetical protein C0J52_06069 [Blattella germanica]|nr:hypothetical protein C0J52_06069 [Blattella germanica]